jgi:biopolymer transport protein ExbB
MTRGLATWLAVAATASTCLAGQAEAGESLQTKSLWDMLLAGGPLMLPIVACSFVLLLVVFERTVSLRRSRVVPRMFAERFLLQISEGALDRQEALERCLDDDSQVANVFAAAVRKWGKPAVEVEQAVIDEGERASNHMRRFLRVINGVATVCPLMGLLGTVWGMMQSFEVISSGSAMGRAELLAGGISGALISTAAGLSVAIPALILYLWFVGRVDSLVTEIDRCGQELVNLISAEALDEHRTRPRGSKAKKVA